MLVGRDEQNGEGCANALHGFLKRKGGRLSKNLSLCPPPVHRFSPREHLGSYNVAVKILIKRVAVSALLGTISHPLTLFTPLVACSAHSIIL